MVQAQKKKPKKRSDVVDVINHILKMADTSRQTSFTPSDIERLYMAGLEARGEKDPVLSKTTPRLVVKKPEKQEEHVLHLHDKMKPAAVEATLGPAVQLEMAATEGNKLDLRKWVKG